MKNTFKRSLKYIAASAFALGLLTGCGNADNAATTDEYEAGDDIGEVVVVTPAAEHGWMAGVIYFAEQAANNLGLENTRILTSTNVAEQVAQLDDLISQGVGAIVLQPHTYELELAAERVLDAEIPLVVFNRYVDVAYDAYVAGSNQLMGEESARKIGEGLNGEGHVVVVSNPAAGSTSAVRVGGFEEVMAAEFPNIELIPMTVENFTQEAGLSSAADILVANQQIDAFFSIDDETSLGILQAIRESGRSDIQFISGGGGAQTYFQEIYTEEDITLFTATYSPRMMGDAIEVALSILKGETVSELDSSNQWIIPPTIITRDNVADYFDADSPY